jgi:hypothetical protein
MRIDLDNQNRRNFLAYNKVEKRRRLCLSAYLTGTEPNFCIDELNPNASDAYAFFFNRCTSDCSDKTV